MTRNGPYRFVRRPMYARTMLMLAGWHAKNMPTQRPMGVPPCQRCSARVTDRTRAGRRANAFDPAVPWGIILVDLRVGRQKASGRGAVGFSAVASGDRSCV
jgi:protein-S-isoprenylcysteine O-methyltransferase Ste14